jgi:diguanylate cyclase (GGDEF)-like protein
MTAGDGDDGADPVVAVVADVLRTGHRPPPGAIGSDSLDALLDQLVDIAHFAQALAMGDLDQELRQRGVVAGSLKGLQGALRHVSWQAQRVAEGDLSQRVDFMGAFSEGFNRMVEALTEAREELQGRNVELSALNEELSVLNAELERLATTDVLTGAWNRRKFNDLLTAELARGHRYGQDLALVLFDIDHFKRVNDTFGHDVGDRVLGELVALVRSEIREVDELARWGGEEFIVLCPGTDGAGARGLAERIRVACAAHAFSAAGAVTVSAGVTSCAADDTPETLFTRVDTALYEAKRAGRDRVRVV